MISKAFCAFCDQIALISSNSLYSLLMPMYSCTKSGVMVSPSLMIFLNLSSSLLIRDKSHYVIGNYFGSRVSNKVLFFVCHFFYVFSYLIIIYFWTFKKSACFSRLLYKTVRLSMVLYLWHNTKTVCF